MAMDKFPVLGHQMTHSIDSFITDSANSATALYTGHKSSVNALGVYADSSPNPLDDPKIQSIAELFHEVRGGGVGIVSTAFIADATPGALTGKNPQFPISSVEYLLTVAYSPYEEQRTVWTRSRLVP
jgi:alkaline phosphatase